MESQGSTPQARSYAGMSSCSCRVLQCSPPVLECPSHLCRADLQNCPGAESAHVQGRSKGTNIELDQSYVVETQEICGRTYTQKQPVGTFSQPNGEVCVHMVSWAVKQTRGSVGDALELYCGNGNFTVPMAQNFGRVVATEVRSKQSCRNTV